MADNKLENKCAWKSIVKGERHSEGNMEFCRDNCDGYNSNCPSYISYGELNALRNTIVTNGR